MIASSSMRLLLAVIATVVFSYASAQNQFRPLALKNPYPTYVLSADGKTLAIYEKTPDEKIFAMFLDLETYTLKPKASFVIDNLTLTPDLKGAWGQEFNLDGYKGSEHWLAYKKHLSWYFPNNTEFVKKQWADQHFILGMRADGMMVVAGQARLNLRRKEYNADLTLTDVNVIDPATGEVKENLRKGELYKTDDKWFLKRRPVLLNNGELLLWSDGFSLFSINLRKGAAVKLDPPVALSGYVGKYGIGAKITKFDSDKIEGRKIVIDVETGAIVGDETVKLGSALGIWVAPGRSGNTFYALHGGNTTLYEQEIVDGKVRVVDSVKLNIDGLFYKDYFRPEYSIYKLIVSKAANRVLLFPTKWSQYDETDGYVWDLTDGKFLYKNEKLIQPSADFLAKNNYVYKEPVKITIAPNVIVLANDQNIYQVVSKGSTGTLWRVVKFQKDSNGNYFPYQEEKAEFDLTYNAKLVNATTCQQCNGGGTTVTISQRNVETTDKMIYNQVTTTRTYEDRKTHACSVCKGLGFTYTVGN